MLIVAMAAWCLPSAEYRDELSTERVPSSVHLVRWWHGHHGIWCVGIASALAPCAAESGAVHV